MAHFRKILIPTDLSEDSQGAMNIALDLAQRYGARLTLLHVYQPPLYSLPPDAVMLAATTELANQVTELQGNLDALKANLMAQGVSDVVTHIAQGDPHDEIMRELREAGHDLLVMATHGRSGLSHMLLGSVAEKLVRHAPCPVLTVRGVG